MTSTANKLTEFQQSMIDFHQSLIDELPQIILGVENKYNLIFGKDVLASYDSLQEAIDNKNDKFSNLYIVMYIPPTIIVDNNTNTQEYQQCSLLF